MKLAVKIFQVCIVILLLLGYQNGALAKAIATPLATDSLIVLHFQTNDSLIYSREDLDTILSNHPEFLFEETFDPTLSYHLQRDLEFSSEAGQDNYCMLYSYFLMQVNGEQKYAAQRKRLFQLFSKINELFALIEQGGIKYSPLLEHNTPYFKNNSQPCCYCCGVGMCVNP